MLPQLIIKKIRNNAVYKLFMLSCLSWMVHLQASSTEKFHSELDSSVINNISNRSLTSEDLISTHINIALPKSKFSVNNASQCLTGNNFKFENTSTVESGTLTYFWNFGDNITSTDKNTEHSYLNPGTYPVKLVITSSTGEKDSSTQLINVYNMPKSIFSINDSTQCSKQNVFVLNNLSTTLQDDIPTYLWKFGDGKSSTLPFASHTYDSSGIYVIKLLITTKYGCSDSSTANVSVYPTPKVSFIVNDTIQPFVGNLFSFKNFTTYIGSAPKYKWLFGDDSTSSSKDTSHRYKRFGSYDVYLIATKDSTGCADTAKIRVRVLPSATAKFTLADTLQCFSINAIKILDSSKVDSGELRYYWNFGDGDSSNINVPTHSYKDTGRYKITLIVKGSLGGVDTTIRYFVLKPNPTARFKPDTIVKCYKGNAFTFSNTSTIPVGTLTYLWKFGDSDTSTVKSPIHSYANSGVYSPTLYVKSIFGCIDSATANVEVLPEVKSVFTVNDSITCFNGNVFKFANKSKTFFGETKYSWKFGDDSTSTDINPNYSYKKAGLFNVSLITNHASGCRDTAQMFVLVNPSPIAKFSINDTVQTLTDNDFIFTNLTYISSGDIKYQWRFGDTTLPVDIINPRHQYDTVGTYTVTLVAESLEGCIDSTSIGVLIFGTVKAICTVNLAEQCLKGNSFEFYSESTINGGNISYLWDFGDGLNAEGQYAFHKYTSPGSYTVKLYATSSAGGKDSAVLSIKVYPSPKVNFIINDSIQCITDNKFIFLNTSTIENNPTPSSKWYLGDSSMSVRQNLIYTYSQPGMYYVKLIATSLFGCKDSTTKPVVVGPQTRGILYDSVLTRKAFNTELNARKFNNASYIWMPSTFLNKDSLRNPIFFDSTQAKFQQYVIQIIDEYGCEIYDTVKILFFTKIDIYSPNAFTPNGDNLNDVFRPLLIGLKELKFFKVYNRWGNMIFNTSDPKSGWDGKYKGQLQPMDTYSWIVVGVDIDGKTVSKSGNFILIK